MTITDKSSPTLDMTFQDPGPAAHLTQPTALTSSASEASTPTAASDNGSTLPAVLEMTQSLP